jgi:hypothetical protein
MRTSHRYFAGVAALTISFGVLSATATSTAASPGASSSPRRGPVGTSEAIQRTGSVRLSTLAHRRSTAGRLGRETAPDLDREAERAATTPSALPPPSPPNTAVTLNVARRGFEGLDHADQRLAGGGNQFSLEPPDQGLCVGASAGATYVVESVNDALQVFDTTGAVYTPPITLSAFFGLAPTINRTTGRFGPFISDPKCYFDVDTQRWFHTALVIGQDPVTGALMAPAYTALAVSQSSDPLGAYFLYRINALDQAHANCPCFGDQPLIGADKNGFYVSTAEYQLLPTFGATFNGAQLYATSKSALESGTASRVIHYSNLTTQSGTVQPATSPGGQYETANGGTEFLVSGRDTLLPDGRLRPGQVRQVSVWSLTNTSVLNSASGAPALQSVVQPTEVYGQPVAMTQRAGYRPLGSSIPEPLPKISANDERVNQVVYAAGHLYTGVNTIVDPGPRTGVAWFIISPVVRNGALTSSMHAQGYVAVANANVSFPAIGVDTAGNGVIAMSLVGPTHFPSSAYQRISASGTRGAVQIAKPGVRPEDGFTCYAAFGGDGVCRWGDYSASVAGPDGRIWSATEFIGARARTVNANWSTFVWPVTP